MNYLFFLEILSENIHCKTRKTIPLPSQLYPLLLCLKSLIHIALWALIEIFFSSTLKWKLVLEGCSVPGFHCGLHVYSHDAHSFNRMKELQRQELRCLIKIDFKKPWHLLLLTRMLSVIHSEKHGISQELNLWNIKTQSWKWN